MLSSGSINNRKNLNIFFAVLVAIILCLAVRYRFYGDDGKAYTNCIDGDGKGYYAYLPAIFIYNDLTFSFFEKESAHLGDQYSNTFILNHNGKNVNKYTCGEALLLLPFFLLATLYSWLFHLPMDGYNRIYQMYSAIGSLVYGLLGLLFVKKYLQKHNLSNISIAIGLTALSLGTNLLNYMIHEVSMSHVFSFAVIAYHVFLLKKYFDSPSLKAVILIGITLGLIILIRPVNGIIVFAYPFLAGDSLNKGWVKHLIAVGISSLFIISIQLIIWKVETGDYIVYGYKNEGFYFNKPPHILDYLFGFKRGAFIYSPVLFFSFTGLFFLFKANAKKFLWLFLFLLLLIYVHASWWSWFYGDGFGERPLVDFYIFFALLISIAFNNLKSIYIKTSAIVLFILSITLHQLFFYQYYYNIIHSDSMNYEKFKYVFLKTDKKYRGIFKCDPEEFYSSNGIHAVDSAFIFFSKNKANTNRFIYNPKSINESWYNLSNDKLQVIFEEGLSFHNKPRFVEFYADYLELKNDSAACGVYFMIETYDSTGKMWFYNSSALAEKYKHTPNKSIFCFERLKLGLSKNNSDKIVVTIANPSQKEVLVKNLKIRIIESAS